MARRAAAAGESPEGKGESTSDSSSVTSGPSGGSDESTRHGSVSSTHAAMATQAPAAPSGRSLGRHNGTLKNIIAAPEKPYGFILCPVLSARGFRDIYLGKDQLKDFKPGAPLAFDVVVCNDGKPQAINTVLDSWARVKVGVGTAEPIAADLGQHTGVLTNYSHRHGYGFISSPTLESTAFVHRNHIRCFGQGCGVQFTAYKDQKGKLKAFDLRPSQNPLAVGVDATVFRDTAAIEPGYLEVSSGSNVSVLFIQDGAKEQEDAWLYAKDSSGNMGWLSVSALVRNPVVHVRVDALASDEAGSVSVCKGATLEVLHCEAPGETDEKGHEGYIFGRLMSSDAVGKQVWLSCEHVAVPVAPEAVAEGGDAEHSETAKSPAGAHTEAVGDDPNASVEVSFAPAPRKKEVRWFVPEGGAAETDRAEQKADVGAEAPGKGVHTFKWVNGKRDDPVQNASAPVAGEAAGAWANYKDSTQQASAPVAVDEEPPNLPEDLLDLEFLGVGPGWQYPLRDVDRRSFVGHLRGALDVKLAKKFLHLVMDGMDEFGWDRPGGMSRGTKWMVAPGCCCPYRYGGFTVKPVSFPPWMNEVMAVCMPLCGLPRWEDWPDSCNLNCYADGTDGIEWHADDEAIFQGFVKDCRIVSLSLGEERSFELRLRESNETPKVRFKIGVGDLCTMEGMTQKHYEHRVPKGSPNCRLRLNLTWRWIAEHDGRYCPRGRS